MESSTQKRALDGPFKAEGYALVGAAMEVYNEQGHGFLLEVVYQECLEMELAMQSIPFIAQPGLTLLYKGRPLTKRYRPDLLVHGELTVELKAQKAIGGIEEAQLLNYLKATGKNVGYLINFGAPGGLEWKRMIL